MSKGCFFVHIIEVKLVVFLVRFIWKFCCFFDIKIMEEIYILL